MDQCKGIRRFLENMSITGCKPVAAPMATKDLMYSDPEPVTAKEHKYYRSAVGSLQYYVTATQWHLAHPTSRLAQKNQSPAKGDL